MSKLFGLDQAIVQASARRLIGTPDTAGIDLPAVFARSVWSRLAEPGDRVAGAVVAAIGPSEALTALLDGTLRRAIRSVEGEREPTHGPYDNVDEQPHAIGQQRNDFEPHNLANSQPPQRSRPSRVGRDSDQSLSTAIERWLPRLQSAEVLRTVDAAAQIGARLLTPEHPAWPSKLNDLEFHAPLALWVRGSAEHLSCPSVSIVGSRAASGYGEHVTAEFAGGLTTRGINIVSGGAYGIDGMAHRAALAGGAPTIAVLAGGVDRLYPSGHEDLLKRIISQGSVLSELPPGFSPTRWRFLQRNRLIAALSAVTLVCEAGTRSGSLNTAAHASSLGRALGAVPGPITSAASAGCHRLLREFDAACITSLDELGELFWGINHESNVQGTCVSGHADDATNQLHDGVISEHGRRQRAPSDAGTVRQAHQGLPERAHEGEGQGHSHDGNERDETAARPGDSGSSTAQNSHPEAIRMSATSIRLLDALRPRAPKTIMELARATGLDPSSVRAGLGELLVEGRAQEHDRGWTHGQTVNTAVRPTRG